MNFRSDLVPGSQVVPKWFPVPGRKWFPGSPVLNRVPGTDSTEGLCKGIFEIPGACGSRNLFSRFPYLGATDRRPSPLLRPKSSRRQIIEPSALACALPWFQGAHSAHGDLLPRGQFGSTPGRPQRMPGVPSRPVGGGR